MNHATLAVVLLGAALPLAAQPAPKPNPLLGLEAYIERVRQEWKIPGLAVGIVKDDSLIFAKGFGLKELGKPDSVTTRTLFAIGRGRRHGKPLPTGQVLAVEKSRVALRRHIVVRSRLVAGARRGGGED